MHHKKCVFVTGAGGFIGSHLCERLVKQGYRVKALVKYNSTNTWGWLENSPCKNKIEVLTGDILNRDMLKAAMKDVQIVFHLAALIGIPYSYYSPDAYIETNVRGTLNILQMVREFGIKKLVHASTSEVYGTAQFVPITEDHPINPQSPYAASKASADFLALSFFRAFGLSVVIVRPFNTYGPRQSARAVIPTVITQILQKKRKIELGSLHPTRDLTYVDDTVEGFIKAAEAEYVTGEVINIGTGLEICIGDLARMIAKLMKIKIEIKFDMCRKRPEKSEVERLIADNSKAEKLLGWRPQYSLEEGLLKTIRWLKLHSNIYKDNIYNI